MGRYQTIITTESVAPLGIGYGGTIEVASTLDRSTGNVGRGCDSESRSAAEAKAWHDVQSQNDRTDSDRDKSDSDGGSSSSSSSGCYLTTACVKSMGLPDDCHQLTVLRRYRDNVLLASEPGRNAVADYYRMAPGIVQQVEHRSDAKIIWNGVFEEICVAVSLIEQERPEAAFEVYSKLAHRLQSQVSATPG